MPAHMPERQNARTSAQTRAHPPKCLLGCPNAHGAAISWTVRGTFLAGLPKDITEANLFMTLLELWKCLLVDKIKSWTNKVPSNLPQGWRFGQNLPTQCGSQHNHHYINLELCGFWVFNIRLSRVTLYFLAQKQSTPRTSCINENSDEKDVCRRYLILLSKSDLNIVI